MERLNGKVGREKEPRVKSPMSVEQNLNPGVVVGKEEAESERVGHSGPGNSL